jgi:hypothetical protein
MMNSLRKILPGSRRIMWIRRVIRRFVGLAETECVTDQALCERLTFT